MARLLFALACAALAIPCGAQPAGPPLPLVLSFEAQEVPGYPLGWTGSPSVFADNQVVHSGKWAARIENQGPEGFATVTKMIPIDFAGKEIRYRGFMRAEGDVNFGGLWMRQDGATGSLAFESMQQHQQKPGSEWAEFTLTLPLNPDATRLFIGALVSGSGKAWADDLQVLIDGKPLWEVPKIEKPKTVLDFDHEFDNGSKISISSLSSVQVANLAKLARVWGFLKYHHPSVTTGKRHWDYDLFRVMPAILAAQDYGAADRALAAWIDGLGAVEPCGSCVELKTDDLHLEPQVGWIDEMGLPALRSIYRNRIPQKQFYVSKIAGVGNPSFDNELPYPQVKPPDAGFQLLALFRFWNIIAYWFPYRDVIGENWNSVLTEFIPRIALAPIPETYARETMALIARVHDTHANLWSSLQLRPPVGTCQIPVHMRFVGNQAVVATYASFDAPSTGLKIGDVLTELHGTPVSKLVETWRPYYAASNEPTILRDMARQMTRGECGETTVRVARGSESLELKLNRVPMAGLLGSAHDQPGETFQMLPNQIAYLKLSSVKIADAAKYIDRAAGSKGLVIDIRNYPSEFMVFALGSLLVDKETEFARFTSGDLSNPGAFRWTPPIKLTPGKIHYPGKVIILVDEVSQSQSEYTTMAFRSAGAKVIGSTTAGADGNVSNIPLPGGLRSMISGIGVFYPDKKPTQRVGILPDIEVKPTIAGNRDGRDELLEEAVRQILTSAGTPAKQ